MRRKDREITDVSKIYDIISKCHCCRVGFNDDGEVYIVPLNFGFVSSDDGDTFYFHGAKDGRKINLIEKNPCVGFELDTNYKLHESDVACGHSARFQSVIGTGIVSIVTDQKERYKGLSAIMEHATGKSGWEFDPQKMNAVCVFKITVKKMSCKEHL